MHPFFADLAPYEVALLLTGLSVNEAEAPGLFNQLAEPLRGRIVERAQQLASFTPEMRSSLMAHEFKNLLVERISIGSGLEFVDPTWLIHRLRGEGPRVVGIVLLGLPSPAMRATLKRLPAAIRRLLPPKSELSQVAPALAQEMRLLFAARFRPMPQPQPGPRSVRDLLFLERAELYRLVRSLGLIELGQAFAAVEKIALVELCRRLDKQDAHELIAAVQTASQVDMPDTKTAQHFLSKVVVNFEDAEEFLQKSGLWRLARATIGEAESWHQAMVQRLPRRVGLLFAELLKRGKDMELAGDVELCRRLQDAILVSVQLLARAGHVSKQWADGPIAYHDAVGCEAALVAAQASLEAVESAKAAQVEDAAVKKLTSDVGPAPVGGTGPDDTGSTEP